MWTYSGTLGFSLASQPSHGDHRRRPGVLLLLFIKEEPKAQKEKVPFLISGGARLKAGLSNSSALLQVYHTTSFMCLLCAMQSEAQRNSAHGVLSTNASQGCLHPGVIRSFKKFFKRLEPGSQPQRFALIRSSQGPTFLLLEMRVRRKEMVRIWSFLC